MIRELTVRLKIETDEPNDFRLTREGTFVLTRGQLVDRVDEAIVAELEGMSLHAPHEVYWDRENKPHTLLGVIDEVTIG